MRLVTASLNYLCKLIGGEGQPQNASSIEVYDGATPRFSRLEQLINHPSLGPRILGVMGMVEREGQPVAVVARALQRRIEARRVSSFDAEAYKCLLLWLTTRPATPSTHAEMGDLYSTVLNRRPGEFEAMARPIYPEAAAWGSAMASLSRGHNLLESFRELEKWIVAGASGTDLVQLATAIKMAWKRELLFAPFRSKVIEDLLVDCERAGAEIAAEILRGKRERRDFLSSRCAEAEAALLRLGANDPSVFSTTFLSSRDLRAKIRESWERFLDGRELRRSISELREVAGISKSLRNLTWATHLTLSIKRYTKFEREVASHVYQAEKELLSLIQRNGGEEAKLVAKKVLEKMAAEEMDVARQTESLYLWRAFKNMGRTHDSSEEEEEGEEEIPSIGESCSSSESGLYSSSDSDC